MPTFRSGAMCEQPMLNQSGGRGVKRCEKLPDKSSQKTQISVINRSCVVSTGDPEVKDSDEYSYDF